MDRAAIRAKRTRQLIDEQFHGVDAEFARKIEVAATQVARWFMDKDNKHRRNIGERMARLIEDRCGLAPYWLDAETGNVVSEPRREYMADRSKARLLELFDGLTPSQRKHFLADMQRAVEENRETVRHLGEKLKEKRSARVKTRAPA